MARAQQRLTQLAVVRDNAVVDERQATGTVEVRVRVLLRHAAVRGPARVPDPDTARRQHGRRVTDLPDASLDDDAAAPTDRDAPRIVAAVLELLEPAPDDLRRVAIVPHVPEDSAHVGSPCRLASDGGARAPRNPKAARPALRTDARRESEKGSGSHEPAGTVSGLCRRVTTPVCSTHDDR